MNKILSGTAAREKILAGAQLLADTVALTIGPRGRNVVLSHGPIITNDGVTIARAIKCSDEYENLGAEILRGASNKTNSAAGDGTTSAIVLGHKILQLTHRQIALGASPIFLKDGLTHAAAFVTKWVNDNAIKVSNSSGGDSPFKERGGTPEGCDGVCSLLSAVASNSCASSHDGALVARALTTVGPDGVVIIDENTRGTTDLTVCEGLESRITLASPYFAADPAKLETVLTDATVITSQSQISNLKDIFPTLEKCGAEHRAVAIIAEDFSPDVISALVLNRVRGGLDVVALKRGKVTNFEAELGDINAILVDGKCEKLICGMTSTKIIAPTISISNRTRFERIAQLRAQIEASTDEYMTQKLRERLARLTSGTAIISVGCATDIETHERKLRMDDALMAASAALRSGIVAGGGVTYIRAAVALERAIPTFPKHLREGAKILASALPSILEQICKNAGVSPDLVIARVRRGTRGYDAVTHKFVDMFAAQIVDPAAVITQVVTNAASVAATLATTEAIVIQ